MRQRMKLTGTNRSIGLIILIRQCPPHKGCATQTQCPPKTSFQLAICRPGGSSGAAAPDPIPNSAVKRPSAHDTSSQDAGKSVAARSANRKLSDKSSSHHTTQSPSRSTAEGLFAFRGYVLGLISSETADGRPVRLETRRPGCLPRTRCRRTIVADIDGPARVNGRSYRRSVSVAGSSS